jgi:hypothetical protein
MSERAPVASVVLRTYNHAPFVAQAIESVLCQRAPFGLELIVAEDCSTDGTRAIVEGYAARHPDLIRTVLPERNVGHGEIFRLALEAVRGSYVGYLDGDDYWTFAEKLARQVDFLERNPECRSCFHDVSLIYDTAGLPSGTVSPGFGETRFGLEQILMGCFVPAPAMVFRRELSDELPGWVFESAWIDWLIHIRAAVGKSIGYLPQTMAAYRVHAGGMFSGLDRISQLKEDLRFYERLRSELPEQQGLIERCVAFRHAQLGIEELGVSYDSCVVLVDPAHELRSYFNGRHARSLPRHDGREVTELEAIRGAVKDLPAVVGDYGPRVDANARQGGCYVAVPRHARRWLRERTHLAAYLAQHAAVTWQNEWASVYELAAPSGGSAFERATRRVEVHMLLPPSGERAGFLDLPHAGALQPVHALAIAGWALANGTVAQTIEFRVDGEALWRTPVNVARPDVGAAFGLNSVERCGFQTTFNAQELAPGATVQLVALFAEDLSLPLAELRFDAGAQTPAPDAAGEEIQPSSAGGE